METLVKPDQGMGEFFKFKHSEPGAAVRGDEKCLQSPPCWALQLQSVPKQRKLVHNVFPTRDDGEAETICPDIIRGVEQGPTKYGIASRTPYTTSHTPTHPRHT